MQQIEQRRVLALKKLNRVLCRDSYEVASKYGIHTRMARRNMYLLT